MRPGRFKTGGQRTLGDRMRRAVRPRRARRPARGTDDPRLRQRRLLHRRAARRRSSSPGSPSPPRRSSRPVSDLSLASRDNAAPSGARRARAAGGVDVGERGVGAAGGPGDRLVRAHAALPRRPRRRRARVRAPRGRRAGSSRRSRPARRSSSATASWASSGSSTSRSRASAGGRLDQPLTYWNAEGVARRDGLRPRRAARRLDDAAARRCGSPRPARRRCSASAST